MKPSPALSRILLYVRAPRKIAEFHARHFGFMRKPQRHEDLIEITTSAGTFSLLLHQASKGHRAGQSWIKIAFDADDIEACKQESARKGRKFGVIYKGYGYEFANARDPARNPIQISRRAFLQ